MSEPNTHTDIAPLRRNLEGLGGKRYWRSLEELAQTEEFRGYLEREFPSQLPQFMDPVTRRHFLVVMGASMGLAGLTGCTRPSANKIVPYVQQPENIVPGEALFYATAMTLSGYAQALLAESHMGRPTKVEGNPDHPASMGATSLHSQASVLDLYDPDRATTVTRLGVIRTYAEFTETLGAALQVQAPLKGAGVRILTETVTSPTFGWIMGEFRKKYPEAKWHQWEPLGRDGAREGARLAFGEPVETRYDFSKADVVLSLDANFMVEGPGHLRYARDFSGRRKVRDGVTNLNRLYMAEPAPSATGSVADHRLPLRATEVESLARAVAAAVGVKLEGESARPASVPEKWFNALVSDLQAKKGASLVIAGEQQPAAVHALAHAINAALGNDGKTVIHTAPAEVEPVNQLQSLRDLVADMNAGKVQVLLVFGGNPVFNAPAELDFVKALEKVALRAHLSGWSDETSEYCHWHLPEAHYLEAWSDARAFDGTASIGQPLIAPLYGGKSALELMSFLCGGEKPSYDVVREYWKTQATGDFEKFWRQAVHDGMVAGTALPPKAVTVKAPASAYGPGPRVSDGLEITFRPDQGLYDGRFANNGWMQELPRTGTTLTWDNAALMSPATAAKLGVKDEDVVELKVRGKALRLPVLQVPGHAAGAVTVHLGYGRPRAGKVGSGVGVNAYPARPLDSPWTVGGVTAVPTGAKHKLARTQMHFLMEGRDLVRSATLEEYRKDPHFAAKAELHGATDDISIYPSDFKYDGHKWGMSIDLNLCNGCNGCVAACQSENNIPVVGKEQVLRGREMHWLRVDRYYEGPADNPRILSQPVPCMHCENAPCEVVCPVAATAHDDEGLNAMVYNRCVGTRYCSNNCPYKVRRFNFFQYQDWNTETYKMMRNPDVTVRQRGVMEKCTYCVQRISHARIQSKNEGRPLRDGDVVTACQAACPTDAIVFGDLNDKKSKAAGARGSSLNYSLLEELNVKPRTTYMAAVRNPHPDLAEPLAAKGHGEAHPAHGTAPANHHEEKA